MALWEDEKAVQAVNRFALQSGVVLLEVTERRTVAELKVTPNTLNSGGCLHGGAIFTLADAAAGAMARADGRRYVTECSDIHFLNRVAQGAVTAVASVIRRGKRSCVIQTEITGGDGRPVAMVTAHFACVTPPGA